MLLFLTHQHALMLARRFDKNSSRRALSPIFFPLRSPYFAQVTQMHLWDQMGPGETRLDQVESGGTRWDQVGPGWTRWD